MILADRKSSKDFDQFVMGFVPVPWVLDYSDCAVCNDTGFSNHKARRHFKVMYLEIDFDSALNDLT